MRLQLEQFKIVRKIAAGEIMTCLGPAERNELKKFIDNHDIVVAAFEEMRAKYEERGYAMQETGVMVRSLYDAQGNNKVLIERLRKANERIVELENANPTRN